MAVERQYGSLAGERGVAAAHEHEVAHGRAAKRPHEPRHLWRPLTELSLDDRWNSLDLPLHKRDVVVVGPGVIRAASSCGAAIARQHALGDPCPAFDEPKRPARPERRPRACRAALCRANKAVPQRQACGQATAEAVTSSGLFDDDDLWRGDALHWPVGSCHQCPVGAVMGDHRGHALGDQLGTAAFGVVVTKQELQFLPARHEDVRLPCYAKDGRSVGAPVPMRV